jgi:hypothetical protein
MGGAPSIAMDDVVISQYSLNLISNLNNINEVVCGLVFNPVLVWPLQWLEG